jgi:predicted chitinase
MLISPPFLATRATTDTEDMWIAACMPGGTVGDGGFPVSEYFGWHGGLHLTAPMNGNVAEPVRAIADGTVVYVRSPAIKPADPVPTTHAQMYRGGWTDNGVVIIRHDTEIGEGANGKVSYFSIYMHLKAIEPTVVRNRMIHRKAVVGDAGRIYGTQNKLHFEIVCDDANLQHLAGRITGDLSLTANGRTNAIYGEVYFHLPIGAQVYASKPLSNNAVAMSQPPTPLGQRAPAPVVLTAGHTTTEELIVGLRYAGGQGAAADRGDSYLTTYHLSGIPLGTAVNKNEAEYKLYTTAKNISESYPASGRPSPSAVYELLRFGRVIGPDALTPATVPNWQEVRYPGGQGWVNLNAANIHKFSDADMPQWMGWKIIDDDTNSDCRCDSELLRGSLRTTPTEQLTETELRARAALPANADKLKKTICKFPTEWDASTIEAKWGWLKTTGADKLSAADFEVLKAHITVLAFWDAARPSLTGPTGANNAPGTALPANHWHIDPREFIKHFRKCGWLGQIELEKILTAAPAAGRSRAEVLRTSMNKMLNKYAVNVSRLRTAHFFAQVGVETGWWQYREEIGNARYFRTMYEIITSQEAAEDYRSGLAARLGLIKVKEKETEEEYAARRPGVVATKAEGMDNGVANALAGGQSGDGPRFKGRGFLQITGRRNYTSYGSYRGTDLTTDPNSSLLATNDYNACDASGFYWVRENISFEADVGATPTTISRVGGLINRGRADRVPLHNTERQTAFGTIWSKLNDLD